MADPKPTALILLNMGGPDALEAVEPFLYNLFSDRELIQLPAGAVLQKPFARLISHFRAKHVVENYRMIGGKSPLLAWTQQQAAGIAQRLDNMQPYVIMRYWHPFSEEVLTEIKQAGCEQAVVLSMYPHYTGATTGSSINDFKRTAARVCPELNYQLIEQWYDWPGYLDALANRIKTALNELSAAERAAVQIVFSAHALPQKFIERGDPYLQQVEATVQGVMQRIGAVDWHLGFQSRSGPVRWMEPETTDVMDRLAAAGKTTLLIVPVSFVSDHIETLHEIDIEYREHAEAHGIVKYIRAASLNAGDDFLQALADLVKDRLENRA